jgi:hypothetical protein
MNTDLLVTMLDSIDAHLALALVGNFAQQKLVSDAQASTLKVSPI